MAAHIPLLFPWPPTPFSPNKTHHAYGWLACYSCRYADELAGTLALELGSGTGIVGLSAACLGANAVLTDVAETSELLQTNVAENQHAIESVGGSAAATVMDWTLMLQQPGWLDGWMSSLGFKFDWILGADLVYSKQQVCGIC